MLSIISKRNQSTRQFRNIDNDGQEVVKGIRDVKPKRTLI